MPSRQPSAEPSPRSLDYHPSSRSARNPPHEKPGEDIEHHRDDKQNQAQLEQCRQVQVVRGFGELICYHRGNCVAETKQLVGDLRPCPNDHCYGDRLTQGATETKDDRSKDSAPSVW